MSSIFQQSHEKILLKIDAIWRANSTKLVRKHSTWLVKSNMSWLCTIAIAIEKYLETCIFILKYVGIISSKNVTSIVHTRV